MSRFIPLASRDAFRGLGFDSLACPAQLRLTGGVAIDCIAYDVSNGGARLKLETPMKLPERIKIKFATKHDVFRAVVCWANGRELGVAFEFSDDL